MVSYDIIIYHIYGTNPFVLLLKLPQINKNRIGVALPFFFCLGTIGFSIVVIENQ